MTRKIPDTALGVRVPLLIAATTCSVAFGLLLAPPAHALDGAEVLLELSHDGVNYSPGTVQDIFPSTGGYVPGESRAGAVWVRNGSADAAQLSLGIVNADPISSSMLPEYLSLQLAAGSASGSADTFPTAGNCHPVIEGWLMAAGEALRLDLTMGLGLDAPNATRNQESNFNLVFVVQGMGGGQPVSPCAGSLAAVPGMALPAELADGVSVGTAGIYGATAQVSGTSTPVFGHNGMGMAANGTLPPGGVGAAPEPAPLLEWAWPWDGVEQSNVVANIRSPWPWIAVLSAGAYMAMSYRSRRRNT